MYWGLRRVGAFYSRHVTQALARGSTVTAAVARRVVCRSEEEIESLGARLADVLGVGDVLLLKGDLGAGKTTLSRGLIRRKFDDDSMRVTSPSYLLDNSYEYGPDEVIHHMDLYRLPTGADMTMLGMPGIFDSCLCIIEWPQRMADKLPREYLDVDLKIQEDETRLITLTPFPETSSRWKEKLEQAFFESK
jgi:tRNA threonylcarbamoyl adenosine modification protein YjeE